MYTNKKVLLIAGGGTLGTYASKELLRLGCYVDVICPEEKISDNERLKFHQSYATEDFLIELFKNNHYDGIIDFLHYSDPQEYKKSYRLLIKNTDHLIFLSSYRVYADEQHPITEDAPRLYDVLDDADFQLNERYAVPKSKCEDFLRQECKGENWTIVRPVISFSRLRMDLVMCSGLGIINRAESGEVLPLPECTKNLSAGVDWAGNSGKLIANLLFKPDAIGEAFTVYSGHGMTWGEVADAYVDTTGVKICWVSEEEYIESCPTIKTLKEHTWMWNYDRKFNRLIDPSKIMRVTGLTADDFSSIRDGIQAELDLLGWKK